MLRGLGKHLVRLIFLFSVVFILAVPYQILVLASPAGERFCELQIGTGDGFVLRFIHSVERTPVESEYRVLSGRIWQFEERIVSHNAGLPTEALPNAGFLMTREWMPFWAVVSPQRNTLPHRRRVPGRNGVLPSCRGEGRPVRGSPAGSVFSHRCDNTLARFFSRPPPISPGGFFCRVRDEEHAARRDRS